MSDEDLISLAQAAREERGGPVHVSTYHRWRLSGIRGIKLETVMRGGRRMTSREAIERFHARVTAATEGGSIPVETNGQRQKAIEKAEAELESMGIYNDHRHSAPVVVEKPAGTTKEDCHG